MIRYEFKAKDFLESSVFAVAFVKEPANEQDLIYLSKEAEKPNILKFEKGVAYSPVLIPDQIIPRKTPSGTPYEGFFTAETIEKLADDYANAEKLIRSNWNLNHDDTQKVSDISFKESWIIEDFEMDKAKALGFSKLPKGTWMVGIKVDNPKVREAIKMGEVKGISIEADLDKVIAEKFEKEQQSIINKLANDMNIVKQTIEKLAAAIDSKEKFMRAELVDGTVVHYEGQLGEGAILYLDEALTQTAPAGTHQVKSEEGVIELVTDEGGVVTSVSKIEEELKEEEKMEKSELDQLSKVVLNAIERLEKLESANKSDKETIAKLQKEVNEHKVKLAKVENDAPESIEKLSASELPVNNYLSNRQNY